MTSQQQADEALAIYQSNPRATAESLLDEFFGRISASRYEDQLQLVRGVMASCPVELKEFSA